MKKGSQVILDYVEGRIDINEFRREFDVNIDLKNELMKPLSSKRIAYQDYHFNLYKYFSQSWQYKKGNWDQVFVRYSIYVHLIMWLNDNKKQYCPYEKYDEDYSYVLKIQPSWIDTSNDDILMGILAKVPKELSRAKQIAWGKARIRELFRFDNTYPRWIQGAEWPIVDGKPLVFSHSEKVKGGEDCMLTRYYFYNPDTSEQTVVEQFT